MNKYIEELKKVTWPDSNEVMAKFWIVLLGIIALIIFFIITDSAVSVILDKIYQ